jgi:hypothetical protein
LTIDDSVIFGGSGINTAASGGVFWPATMAVSIQAYTSSRVARSRLHGGIDTTSVALPGGASTSAGALISADGDAVFRDNAVFGGIAPADGTHASIGLTSRDAKLAIIGNTFVSGTVPNAADTAVLSLSSGGSADMALENNLILARNLGQRAISISGCLSPSDRKIFMSKVRGNVSTGPLFLYLQACGGGGDPPVSLFDPSYDQLRDELVVYGQGEPLESYEDNLQLASSCDPTNAQCADFPTCSSPTKCAALLFPDPSPETTFAGTNLAKLDLSSFPLMPSPAAGDCLTFRTATYPAGPPDLYGKPRPSDTAAFVGASEYLCP